MQYYPRHDTPPPCPERCWRSTDLGGWIHTAGIDECGHHYDPDARIWRWRNGHPAVMAAA